ncbi:MAG: tetratricopeptide repeat protein, partial [Parvibaculum sp.]
MPAGLAKFRGIQHNPGMIRTGPAILIFLAALLAPLPAFAWSDDAERCFAVSYDAPLALGYCNRALEEPGLPDADRAAILNNRGVTHTSLGQFDEAALADLEAAIDLDPQDSISFNNRCWLYAEMGRAEEALADCDEALRLRPRDAIAIASRSYALLKAGRLDEALADADRAADLAPGFWQS